MSVTAAIKKQNGTLSITSDRKTIIWDATPSNSAATITIAIANVTNFQQSPVTAKNASVKVIFQLPDAPEKDDYVFRLTSSTAKEDKEGIVSVLSEILTAQKKAATTEASSTSTPKPNVVAGIVQETKDVFADSEYLNNTALQKSYLDTHPDTNRIFLESFTTLSNDGGMNKVAFNRQFWSSRVHLLRSHDLEQKQKQASYNVLATLDAKKDKDDKVILNATVEQVNLMFKLYPIVLRIFHELVPPMNQTNFWKKFFVSKLFLKLKGHKFTGDEPDSVEFDKYLDEDVHGNQATQFSIDRIPRFFDVDGNEQDHTETLGNMPDVTMRHRGSDEVPILRALNSLSEKLMANVAPVDGEDLYNPVGMDEKKFDQLQLKDLQNETEDRRVHLNVPSQQSLFSQNVTRQSEITIKDPEGLMKKLRSEVMGDSSLKIELDNAAKHRTSTATRDILKTIGQRAVKSNPRESKSATLSTKILESTAITHSTSIEFLHYFWDVYLSGDESRASEVAGLAETLDKSWQRIEAMAKDAETEREDKLQDLKRKQEEYYNATKKRIRINPKEAGGGADVVRSMLAATEKAVRFAEEEYKKTYNEQMAQMVGS